MAGPDSRHGKTGLYKVRLTVGEVFTLGIDEIRALAARPRMVEDHLELTPIPDDEWLAVDALVDIWARAPIAAEDEGPTHERRAGTVTDEARDRQTVAAIAASWPAEKKADLPEDERVAVGQVSRHHDFVMPIVGFLARRTADEHLVELLFEAAKQSGDRDFQAGRDYRSEIERLVASSSEKVAKGEKAVGLPTLAEKFPALADVLRTLWPDLTIEFDEAEGEGAVSWPEPERRLDLPAAPALDLALFPPEVANVTLDAAERLQCPPDYVAWGLTVCLAGLIGRGVGIRPRQRDDWTERACLWVALVGEPSWMKSPPST